MSGARRSYGCAYRVSEQHPGPLLPLNARGKASHRGAAALNSATARPAAHRPANRTRPSSLRGGAHFAAVCGGSTAQGSMHVSLRPLAERGGNYGPAHQCAWQRCAVASGAAGGATRRRSSTCSLGLRGWAMGTAGFTGGCPAVKYWPCTRDGRILVFPTAPKKEPWPRRALLPTSAAVVLVSLSLYYMYTRDNGVPIGLFRQFRLDLQTCFDVLAVRSEVQTQG